MGETSKIAWTDATWNCIIGCSHVSPGCERCYAEALATRYGWTKKPWGAQYAVGNVILKPQRLDQPLRWRKPRRIFVNSMSDLFHEQVPDEFIDQVFGVMAWAKKHTFQILTKRPERMLSYLSHPERRDLIEDSMCRPCNSTRGGLCGGGDSDCNLTWGAIGLPLPNVWLGVSVEDQRRADERIPLLLQTPAAVRFLSCEPLLGPVNLADPLGLEWELPPGGYRPVAKPLLDWVIVGGESGPNYRSMDLDWARSIRDQCVVAGSSFFYKQSSGSRAGMNPSLDGVEWHQFPNDGDSHA